MNLINLVILDICDNHLYTDDQDLSDFLDSVQCGGDWESCQTPYLPIPDIKANGSAGPITIPLSQNVKLTIHLDAGGSSENSDYWVLCDTTFDWYYYNLSLGWQPGIFVTYQDPLFDFGPYEVMNRTLPAGLYTCYFGVDTNMNGIIDLGDLYYDSVNVTVQ